MRGQAVICVRVAIRSTSRDSSQWENRFQGRPDDSRRRRLSRLPKASRQHDDVAGAEWESATEWGCSSEPCRLVSRSSKNNSSRHASRATRCCESRCVSRFFFFYAHARTTPLPIPFRDYLTRITAIQKLCRDAQPSLKRMTRRLSMSRSRFRIVRLPMKMDRKMIIIAPRANTDAQLLPVHYKRVHATLLINVSRPRFARILTQRFRKFFHINFTFIYSIL